MKKILLDRELNKYKANLHCHSTVSDGLLTPEEIKNLYKKNGYSIVAFTDHDVMIAHDELNDEGFLALHGYEMEIIDGDYDNNKKTCHICLIQRDPDDLRQVCWHRSKYLIGNAPDYRDKVQFDNTLADYERSFDAKCISDMMHKGRENGFFVTYNHPTWSLEVFSDYMNYTGMHAMEIFNYGCYIEGFEEYNPRVYDDMLRGGKRIYCIAADDNHNWHPFESQYNDSCGGFTVILSEKLSYKNVMDALFDGKFYASQGPEIFALSFEDGIVHVECSPAKRVTLSTNRRGSKSVGSDSNLVTEADFTISEEDTYFRITVIDENGRHANTNAYWLEEIK